MVVTGRVKNPSYQISIVPLSTQTSAFIITKGCIVTFLNHTLPNGLTIVGEPSPQARSVALGFFVRTGSRDEVAGVSGVTHFLEHMVFKGTPRRTALDVNRDFDRIGANYNAFTSEENTVFYAAILPEYLPQAVDVLADILRPSLTLRRRLSDGKERHHRGDRHV